MKLKKKSKGLKNALASYVDQTTLHGLTYINSSPSLFVKLTWTVVFCIFFAFGGWLLYRSFNTYLTYETSTSVRHIRVSEMTFPSVTICNLYYTQDILLKNYSAEVINNIASMNNPLFIGEMVRQGNNIDLIELVVFAQKYYKSLLDQDKIGFDWKEMLIGCYFMNYNCDLNSFKEVISRRYGRCYTTPGSGNICKLLNSFKGYY